MPLSALNRPTLRQHLPLRAVTLAFVGLLLATSPSSAQQGPIQLFPNLDTTPEQPGGAGGRATTPGTLRSEGEVAAPQGFRIEGLAAPGIDDIGLAGPAEGGFDQSLWAGSNGDFVLVLLKNLPVVTENPSLRALTRRLLMTGAPIDEVAEPGSVLGARAERLLAMGDLDGASALLDRVPATESDSQIARLVVQAALLRGDDDGACRRAADITPTSGAVFWSKVTIYCRLADGDEEGARLGLALLRDQGATDDAAFFALVQMIADGQPANVPLGPAGPSALHVALYRLADLPLPAPVLNSASPELLAAAARDPRLVAGDQLAVAEQAFLYGALSAGDLATRYNEQETGPTQNLARQVANAWDPQTRALAYQLVPAQEAQDRGQTLDALWRSARGAERFLVADLFADSYAGLPAQRGRLRLAPSFARALLASERPIPAARWFSLLDGDGGADQQARDDLAGLRPLFALAGFGGSVSVPDFSRRDMAEWLANTDGGLAKAPASAGHDRRRRRAGAGFGLAAVDCLVERSSRASTAGRILAGAGSRCGATPGW